MPSLTTQVAHRLLGSSFSVSGTYLFHLIPMAKELGLDVETLLTEAGIDQHKLGQPDYRVPLFKILKMQALQQELNQDPALGIKLGAQVRPRFFQVLGYAAMSANTLGDAIQQLLRFEKLVWDLGISDFKQGKDTSVIRLKTLLPEVIPAQMVELAMAGWISFGRDIVANQSLVTNESLPLAVHFSHQGPEDSSAHQAFFNCPVLFGQKENAVIIPSYLLNEATKDADPQLQQMMNLQGDALLKSYMLEVNLSNEVRACICRQLSCGEPDVSDIAEQLDTNARNLRRRLQELKTSFKELVDEVRYELAQAYLADKALSLVDIAFMLGFSEQSAFSRAFKRWQGQTPSQFRERL